MSRPKGGVAIVGLAESDVAGVLEQARSRLAAGNEGGIHLLSAC